MKLGRFGFPKPQGWTIERIADLMAGAIVLATLILGYERSRR